ncbi:amino acid permease [bacterium]|nr:amino acid permease [bacterium]
MSATGSDAVKRQAGHGFGTAPVFLAAVSTILGAILFLRFGYAVGNVGILGAVAIVLIGHAITIPTGLAVAEIATNLKVEGGGEYFIISRSFGATVGGVIGISLYLSQAVSVAFYLIAFSEAFRPLFPWIESTLGFTPDVRMISIPAAILLAVLIARKGANVGVGALWVVVVILAFSIGAFFLGGKVAGGPDEVGLADRVANPDSFFRVFAIIFPAFTGMTAGVGLSGDLRNPRRSIPVGTLAATITGMVVYLLIVAKMAWSATPEQLAGKQFIMSDIAIWGPIIPIGLAAATVSSAIGSILVAPRTLQALANDRILPVPQWNTLLSKGTGAGNDPANATWLTAGIMLVFVSLGNVDVVAQIISMFFMITYGTLCAISFFEHFAGNPSYRPTFRTKWYLSLLGAAASFIVMFQMQPGYATLALIMMAATYVGLQQTRKGERDLTAVVRGVLYQMTRNLQVMIQKRRATPDVTNWRPSFIAISQHSLERVASFELLRWISHYYGFGTYIHFINGPLSVATNRDAKLVLNRLIEQTEASEAGVYVDTIISPSFKTAVAQIVQIPGMAGMDNNSILFEFDKESPGELSDIIDGSHFAAIAGMNICILRSSERHFGYHRAVHVWLNPGDFRNANLMILLAYIIVGHPDWKRSEIKLFAAFEPRNMDEEVARLHDLIEQGRIPISSSNLQAVALEPDVPFDDLVAAWSNTADLVITGFSLKKMTRDKGSFLHGFRKVQDILFVRAGQDILITDDQGEGVGEDLLNGNSIKATDPEPASEEEQDKPSELLD